MSVEFHRGSPGKFDSRMLSRETLSRWTGRTGMWLTVHIVKCFAGVGCVILSVLVQTAEQCLYTCFTLLSKTRFPTETVQTHLYSKVSNVFWRLTFRKTRQTTFARVQAADV